MGGSLGERGTSRFNIAQKIANIAQRTVLAATCPISLIYTKVQSINPLMLSHPAYSTIRNFLTGICPENNENLFKTFHPVSRQKKSRS